MAVQPRTAEIMIYQGDDRAKIGEAGDAIEMAKAQAKESGPRLNGESDPVADAVSSYNSLISEAKERALKVKLSAVRRLKWRELMAEHPAREDHPEDKSLGVNEETFGPALILACWQDDSISDRAAELDSLCEADYQLLLAAAWGLNKSQGFDPKAVTVSEVIGKNVEM